MTSWANADEAFTDVARGIRSRRGPPNPPPVGPSPPAGGEAAGRSRSQRLPAIWNVPYLRNPHFTGRDELLDELHGKLTNGRVALTAVRGMGGVGKTQLALEYAYRHAGDFDLVWWLRAEEPATLLEDYAALAGPLGLAQAGESEIAAVAAAVCQELTRRDAGCCVFDNANDAGRDRAPAAARAAGPGADHLAQPRLAVRSALDVPILSRPAAVELPAGAHGAARRSGGRALAQELGDLPLALEQAAAYMVETGFALADYLQLLPHAPKRAVERGEAAAGYPATVGTTWTMAVDRLRAEEPRAVDLLNLCAFLAPEAIPRRLLTEHHAALPSELGEALADPLRLNRLVGALRRYSLVDVTAEDAELPPPRPGSHAGRARAGGHRRWVRQRWR